jgi:hypothetical protein
MMTPVTPRESPFLSPDEPWTTRYETMRGQVMTKPCTLDHVYGYALFVRRGLAAWMRSWPRPTPGPSRDVGPRRAVDDVMIPSHFLRSATSLLANMILITDARAEVPREQRPLEGLARASSS